MKRKGYIFEQIADIDNLRFAFWKAQKGKSQKKDVAAFRANLDSNLLQIRNELLEGSYRYGDYHYFTIYDPKRRVICAASFAERVLHHAVMNICAIDFDNRQIPHSYACRKGKGTFAALEQTAQNQKRFAWYLKLDVRKYFDSISHDLLFEKLQCIYKDEKLLRLFWHIIDSYHASDNCGLPIGNLTSQYFANHYLSYADRYATEQLRIPAYVRYMDDMLLWANTREELLEKGREFEKFISNNLYLSLKPAVINKAEHGLPALGFQVFPQQIRLNKNSCKRFIEKTAEYSRLLQERKIDEKKFAQNTLSLYGFISHATHSNSFARKIQEQMPEALSV